MDTIFIQDFKIETVVGIHDWERRIKQSILLDLEFAWDVAGVAKSDTLADTLDYAKLTEAINHFARHTSFYLIETLAERLAHFLSSEFQISWLKLTVKKPGAIPNARMVGVSIERQYP